jgi:hypothetical protein
MSSHKSEGREVQESELPLIRQDIHFKYGTTALWSGGDFRGSLPMEDESWKIIV